MTMMMTKKIVCLLVVAMGFTAMSAETVEIAKAKKMAAPVADSKTEGTVASYQEAAERGRVLLLGDRTSDSESAPANPAEGLRLVFWAATNGVASACRDLATAYELGIGLSVNLTHAYVWQRLAREFDSSSDLSALDRLAVRLSASEIQIAQQLARSYAAGNWPPCPERRLVRGDARFTLNGVTGGRVPLAVINQRTIAVGETCQVPVKDRVFSVRCLEVRPNGAVIEVAGENEAYLLALD